MNKIILVVLLSTTIFADVISVTGFRNNTSNPKNDWIGEAIADNLTTDLSKIDKIKVVSRSSLKDVLKEQKFTHSGLVEQDKSIKQDTVTRSPAPGRSNASSGKFVTENDLGWFRMLRRLHYTPDSFFL